jgi:hypothetical protein
VETNPTVRAHANAELLLDRYGIVTRGAAMAEDIEGGFAGVYRILAAAEESGRVRRGYFVEGLGAAQFGFFVVRIFGTGQGGVRFGQAEAGEVAVLHGNPRDFGTEQGGQFIVGRTGGDQPFRHKHGFGVLVEQFLAGRTNEAEGRGSRQQRIGGEDLPTDGVEAGGGPEIAWRNLAGLGDEIRIAGRKQTERLAPGDQRNQDQQPAHDAPPIGREIASAGGDVDGNLTEISRRMTGRKGGRAFNAEDAENAEKRLMNV